MKINENSTKKHQKRGPGGYWGSLLLQIASKSGSSQSMAPILGEKSPPRGSQRGSKKDKQVEKSTSFLPPISERRFFRAFIDF